MPNVFVDVRHDIVYAYGWPSRLVRPIWKVKRAPKLSYASFRRHFLGDRDFDVKNAKFFRGRPSRPCLCIRLAITLVRPIWKVKLAPKRAYASFRRFYPFFGPCLCIRLAITACATNLEGHTSPEASIRLILTIFVPCLCIRLAITACPTHLEDSYIKMPNFFADVRQDIVYAYGWPPRLVRPIWMVKRASKHAYASFRLFSCAIAHHFLGGRDSDVKNAKFFRGRPSRPCLSIRLAITACPTHLEGQTSPEASIRLISTILCQIFSWTFVKTLSMHTAGHHGLSDPFGRSNEPRSKHTPHFDDFHYFLGDRDSDVKNAKFFCGRPSRPCRHTVGHYGLSEPFGRSNEPRSEHTPHFDDFRVLLHTIFWVIGIPTSKMPNFFVEVRQDLVYAYDWPSRLVRPILEGQTSPEASIRLISTIFVCYCTPFLGDRDSDVKNAKFFRGRPSRPCLCIRLAITACPTHLEAYASFRRFSCAIAHHFLGDRDPDVKNAKFFRGCPSRPCLCIRLAITACPTHLEGQTSPEASTRLILTIFVCYCTPFFG
uniref:Uncharacterized protein n=1 Tax=Solanum lycopersicum TaxID=4081 RepID=A0A3Q7GK14_SOLLC